MTFIKPRKSELASFREKLVNFSRALDHYPMDYMGNGHMMEWRKQALNYWRCMELPLSFRWLTANDIAGERVLDLGSPKLLSLALATLEDPKEVIASDISDYFLDDLSEFSRDLQITNLTLSVIDARDLPYRPGEIDSVVSVSVIEHIPNDGDSIAMREIARVLRPGGRCVLTVPYYVEFLEEFQNCDNLYWTPHTVRDDSGIFYQRRYDWESIEERLLRPSGMQLRSVALIGEKPVRAGRHRNTDGRLVENWNFLERLPSTKILKAIGNAFGNRSEQWIHSFHSRKHHYFTEDLADPQVLCVALELVKSACPQKTR